MGAYLTTPIKDKDVDSGETENFMYSCAAMQGWRTEMEDAHLAATDLPKNTDVFGVFDGHGGKEVAKFVALHFAEEFQETEGFKKNDLKDALKCTYLGLDELMMQERSQQQLVDLAGDDVKDGEELKASTLDGIPEFQVILAPQKGGVQSMGQNSQPIARDVQSFPIDVAAEEVDDDDEEEEEEEEDEEEEEEEDADAEEEAAEEGEGEENEQQEEKQEQEEGKEDMSAVEGTGDRGSEIPTTKRRKGDGEPSNLVSNGSHKEPSNRDSENAVSDQTPAGVRQESVLNEEGSGEAESPKTPEDRIVMSQEGRLKEMCGPSAGCTAVVAAIRGNRLYVANAGDSRCVLSRGGKAVPMSFDHKPTDQNEESRIRKAGGFVTDGRVNGSLNLSRALGDMEYKRSKDLPPGEQMITAMPDIKDIELEKGDDFMILACDGIWDVLDHQESVDFVQERLKQKKNPETICKEMCDHCLADDTDGTGEGCDNMTAMVVLLKKFTRLDVGSLPKSGEGTLAS